MVQPTAQVIGTYSIGTALARFTVYTYAKASAPSITPAAGTFDYRVPLRINGAVNHPNARCTLDGSEPSATNFISAPTYIEATSTLKVRNSPAGYEPSDVVTQTYVIRYPLPYDGLICWLLGPSWTDRSGAGNSIIDETLFLRERTAALEPALADAAVAHVR